MAIYRGTGGAGDATGDATNSSQLALAAANQAQASATSATSSATSAANSASSAATDAADAATSETNAAASASTASTQATSASNSATSAASSATAASSSASSASSSASSASTSATNAASSASSASTNASSASTSATNAANSAAAAATSATNAAASAAAAATFDPASYLTKANPSFTGNLTASGTGNRITGDFSNATVANRVMFQTSTANSATSVSTVPSGTNTQSDFFAFNAADPNNASLLLMRAGTAETTLRSAITGTGTYLPMTFYTGGSERMRVDTSGNVGIGTSSPRAKFDVNGASALADSDYGYGVIELGKYGTGDRFSYIDFHSSGTPGAIDFSARLIRETGANGNLALINSGTGALTLSTSGTERMRIDSNGIVTGTAGNLMLVSGTAVSASGTSVTFTGIPSWVKRITVMCSGISTNGTSDLLLRLGYSGGVETSGYLGAAATIPIGSANVTNYTAGFGFSHSTGNTAARIWYYTFVLTNVSGNTWMCAGTGGISDAAACYTSAGNKTTSGTLDRISITTAGGTNTFDAGSINIMYE